MNSARLPGKVLRLAAGKPMLAYLVDRLTHATRANPVVVATSDTADDDAVASFCGQYGVTCIRGPLDDVMARFLRVLDETGARAFVRVNGDSPLIDASLIGRAVKLFMETEADLVTNVQQRTYPKGMSVEVVDGDAFRQAAAQADDPEDREHVTRCFYRHPERWRIAAFTSGRDLGKINLSVDTGVDFARFEAILAQMNRPHWQYGLDGVLALMPAQVGASV